MTRHDQKAMTGAERQALLRARKKENEEARENLLKLTVFQAMEAVNRGSSGEHMDAIINGIFTYYDAHGSAVSYDLGESIKKLRGLYATIQTAKASREYYPDGILKIRT